MSGGGEGWVATRVEFVCGAGRVIPAEERHALPIAAGFTVGPMEDAIGRVRDQEESSGSLAGHGTVARL
jgi:hypothetical protein